MEIILARPRGFCAGVKRAIGVVNQALNRYGSPIYILHEIVHNSHVIKELSAKGAIFVKTLEEIPGNSIAIFSAHGVAKSEEDKALQLGLYTIDATCPLVTMIHRRVARLNKIGYDVLMIGHKGHPEVEGTCGRAQGTVHVISTLDDVANLQVVDPTRIGYVTQTTLNINDAARLITAVNKRFPEINAPEQTDICYATRNRQSVVRDLALVVDLFLVVGSKNSSNSNRLRETAANCHIPAYLIDHAREINPAWLQNINKIGVTAGASAPEILVQEVVSCLQKHGTTTITEITGMEESIQFKLPDFTLIDQQIT